MVLTNTQMFACLFGDAMILRLSEPNRAAVHAEGWKAFEPMPGRPMREVYGRARTHSQLARAADAMGAEGARLRGIVVAEAEAEALAVRHS
jgi:hypothetical protein